MLSSSLQYHCDGTDVFRGTAGFSSSLRLTGQEGPVGWHAANDLTLTPPQFSWGNPIAQHLRSMACRLEVNSSCHPNVGM